MEASMTATREVQREVSTASRAAGPIMAVRGVVQETLRGVEAAYGREDRALRGYVPLLVAFASAAGAVAGVARLSGRRPDPLTPWDLVTMSLATHKVGRLIAKDAVTSPLRAPFARFQGAAGDAEVQEEVAGHGAHKALGELVTCPFCVGPWAALTLVTGRTFVPALTRVVEGGLSAVALADFLQVAYATGQQRTEPPEQREQQTEGSA
jgi:hypothetical protein